MRQAVFGLLSLAALAGCADWPETRAEIETLDLVAETRRTMQWSWYDNPFTEGPVTVLTAEHGRLRGYTLVPCRGGTRVCAGSSQGRVGTLTRTPDYDVIQGAYAGRTFYLSPGGDGYLVLNGQTLPLAWN